MRRFSRGDFVIYEEARRQPASLSGLGGQVAVDIVEHYMTVCESSRRGTLVLQTHGGRIHVTQSDDPNIRRAPFWQRWFRRDRFPRLKQTPRSRAV